MTRIAAAATLVLLAGCATTLENEARQAAADGADPGPLIAALGQRYAAIEATKRIFDVSLLEGRRRFSGEGAVEYRADPRRLKADVYGPHGTPIVHVRLSGDDLTVTLPQEGEVLTGQLGDPQFAALTGERALVSPEILGALLGAYDVDRLVDGAVLVAAAADGDRRTLYLGRSDALHALTMRGPEDRLVEYRQARHGRLVVRVQFDDFRSVDGRESPHRVVLRDYVKERQLVIDVTRERKDVSDDL